MRATCPARRTLPRACRHGGRKRANEAEGQTAAYLTIPKKRTPVEPFSLLAIAAGVGWLLEKFNTKEAAVRKKPAHLPDQGTPRQTTVRPDKVQKTRQTNRGHVEVRAIDVLPEYQLVKDMVNRGFPLIFVTGGAGTGKSTFVRWLMQEFDGFVLTAAPTGIAALNISGKTLHSLCSLPPAGWIRGADIQYARSRRLTQEAKLLIIDEISMVNANILDAASAFFRKNRGGDRPFGGLPVVVVGDLFQLPPVVDDEVADIFERNYSSTKFFAARSIQSIPYYAIEMKKAFRQTDQAYVDLLARLREGVDLEQAVTDLNSRCEITQHPPAGAVWLSPRNAEVTQRNTSELNKLMGTSVYFHGVTTGKFKRSILPAPMQLELRVGAQVMFTKNGLQWVNGSIGHVAQLCEDYVSVRLSDSEDVVDVRPAEWEAYEFDWNPGTGKIERTVAGTCTQIPLILAWSTTIHKSQGKTIDRVHLDLGGGAFEAGQTYVALSRCRSLSGLTLHRPLSVADVLVDAEARRFYEHLRELASQLPPDLMKQKMSQEQETPKATSKAAWDSDIPF